MAAAERKGHGRVTSPVSLRLRSVSLRMKPNSSDLILACALWLAMLLSGHGQPFRFSTIAGLPGQQGYADGTNSDATFNVPGGFAIDASGAVYVGDNARIRKLVRSGTEWVLTTLPLSFGTGIAALALDSAGNLYVSDPVYNGIWKFTLSGTNWNGTLIAGGTTLEGFQDGTNSAARFNWPLGIAVDTNGTVYVADLFNDAIRKITPIGTNWVTTTIAGGPGSALVDGTNRTAKFDLPHGLALDNAGSIYVADSLNFAIRRITPIGTNWVTTTIAGASVSGNPVPGSRDGTNRVASFNEPFGVAVASSGTVYVADTYNHTLRQIVPVGTNWVTTTTGGLAGSKGVADGIGGDARFNRPFAVAVDSAGNLLVADTSNYAIRLGMPAFSLQAFASQAQIVLSWPTAASNYVLETSASFDPDSQWTALTSGVAIRGDTFVVTNQIEVPAAFFRLRR